MWLVTWRVLTILTPIVIDCQIHNTASFDVRFLTDNPFSLPMMTSSPGSIMVTMLLAKSFFLEFLFLQTFFLIPYNHLSIFQLTNFYDFQTDADWSAAWTNQRPPRDRIGTRMFIIYLKLSLSLLFSAFKLISSPSISWKAFFLIFTSFIRTVPNWDSLTGTENDRVGPWPVKTFKSRTGPGPKISKSFENLGPTWTDLSSA